MPAVRSQDGSRCLIDRSGRSDVIGVRDVKRIATPTFIQNQEHCLYSYTSISHPYTLLLKEPAVHPNFSFSLRAILRQPVSIKHRDSGQKLTGLDDLASPSPEAMRPVSAIRYPGCRLQTYLVPPEVVFQLRTAWLERPSGALILAVAETKGAHALYPPKV